MIWNRFLPFPGFTAINLFGIIFIRKGCRFTPVDLLHERIHTRQQRELLFIPFYLLYVLEWLWRLLQTRPLHHLLRRSSLLRAYRRLSFEREAYEHQNEPDYLSSRTHYAWVHYL